MSASAGQRSGGQDGRPRVERVAKRDGRETPFDRSKIESAVARAQQAAGDDDPQLARETAELVCLALERRFGGERGAAVPPIEAIQDLVEQALVELGRFQVAKSYILYRDRRARIRAATVAAEPAEAGRGVMVQDSVGLEPWRKDRIVAALMEEAELPRAQAEEVAAQVESKVLASGLRRLTTTLIRELVDHALVERQAAAALSRARPVSVPRKDLEQWLATEKHPRSRVADEVLLRWSQEHLLPPATVERHLAGDIHVMGLHAPHQSLAHALPLETLCDGEPGAHAAFGALDEIAAQAHGVSAALVLDESLETLAALARGRRGGEGGAALRGWLQALAAVSAAANRPIELALCSRDGQPAARERGQLALVLQELSRLAQADEPAPRVVLDLAAAGRLVDEDAEARLALERLLERRQVRLTWSADQSRPLGHGLVRRAAERGPLRSTAGVALNLPRAARRAGAWREDLLFAELQHLVEVALDAHATLAAERRNQRLEGARMRGRASCAVSLAGLREAVRLCGDGETRPEAAARMLAFLAEACERLGSARGMAAHLDLVPCDAAAARFARLDAELWPLRQGRLFDEEAVAARGGCTAATELHARHEMQRLGGEAVLDAHAQLVAALREGALDPRELLEGCALGRSGEDAPLALALSRLAARRARIRSGAAPLVAVQRAARAGATLFALESRAPHSEPRDGSTTDHAGGQQASGATRGPGLRAHAEGPGAAARRAASAEDS